MWSVFVVIVISFFLAIYISVRSKAAEADCHYEQGKCIVDKPNEGQTLILCIKKVCRQDKKSTTTLSK